MFEVVLLCTVHQFRLYRALLRSVSLAMLFQVVLGSSKQLPSAPQASLLARAIQPRPTKVATGTTALPALPAEVTMLNASYLRCCQKHPVQAAASAQTVCAYPVLQAVVGGTASSGVIICLLRVLTKAALPATRAGLRKSTSLYFGISGAICLACWGIYYAVLPRLGVVRHYKQINAAGIVKYYS